MGITIANLIAQIGMDLTQFKVGMNEVDARLSLTDIKAKNAAKRITNLRTAATAAAGAAKVFEQERYNQGVNTAALRNKERNAALIVKASEAEYKKAYEAYQDAIKNKKPTSVQNKFEEAWGESEQDLKLAKSRHLQAERELKQHYTRMNAIYRDEQRSKISAAKKSELANQFEEESKAIEEVSRKYAARMTQNATQHKIRAANAVASIAGNVGLAGAGGLGVATKFGADYNQMMVTTAHNTSLSTAGVGIMNEAVAKLGAESGASLEGLAGGFREIENRGYTAAQAVSILTPAMQAAVAKGADLASTTRLLTNIMKEFGIPVERASDAMGVLVETSRRSGHDMSELVDVFGTMSAYSANLGVSLNETATAYIVLTRHGLNATQAATQFRNDINKIIKPSKEVIGVLKDLQKATKVPLIADFSGAGLRNKGLLGVMNDVRKAAGLYKGGTPTADVVTRVFPLQRGQLGASILTGTGFAETAGVLKEVNAAEKGGVALTGLYKESLGQLNQQMDRLKNTAILVASSVASALTPSIEGVTTWINNLVTSFNVLDQKTKSAAVGSVAFASALLIATAVIGKTIVAVNTLNTAFIEMGAANGIMGLAADFGPVGIVIAAVAAAAYGLWYITNQLATAEQRATEETHARADALVTSTRAQYENKERAFQLVEQYNRLAVQTHHTTEQSAHMQQILDQISQMAPDLVTGFNNSGHAIGLVGNAAMIAAQQLYNMGVQARVAQAAVLDLQAAQALAKINDLKEKQRVTAQQLVTGTVNMSGERERQQVGANLGGQWRPATPQEVSSHAPGLKKVGGTKIPYIPWLPAGPVSYFVPQREKEDDGRDKIFGNTTPEMRALAAQKRQVDTDAAAAQRQYDDLIKQAKDTLTGSSDPLGRTTPPPFPHPDRGDGIDKMAGVGGKEKKGKTAKETDAEKLRDKYTEFIDKQRESMFLAANSGQYGENAEQAKAMWETMSHGAVEYQDHVIQLKGDFAGLQKVYRDHTIEAVKATQIQKQEIDSAKKLLELRQANALAAFIATKNQSGTEKTPEQIEQFKLAAGMYHEYGVYAAEAAKSTADAGMEKRKADIDDRIKKLQDEISEPGKGEGTIEDQTYKKIKDDPELYIQLGEAKARAMAHEAQQYHDNGEAAKLYTTEIDKMREKTAEYIEESNRLASGRGMKEKTEEETLAIAMKGRAYDHMGRSAKEALIAEARHADVVNATNKKTVAVDNLHDAVQQSVEDAQQGLYGAQAGPVVDKAMEYKRKMLDILAEQTNKLTVEEHEAVVKEINDAASVIAAYDKKAKAAEKLSQTYEDIKQKLTDMTTKFKVNVDGVKINTQEWDRLTDEQKSVVKQFEKMNAVKDQVDTVMSGIEDIFGKSLDNIHEHGFRSFFKDIIKDFDDMLFNMSKKWAESQFKKVMTNISDDIMGKLGGKKKPTGDSDNPAGIGTPGIAPERTGGSGISGLEGLIPPGILEAIGLGGNKNAGFSMGGADLGSTDLGSAGADANMSGIDFGGFLADGGTTRAGMMYVVGDGGGPELFMPGRSGTVIPHDAMQALGGHTINLHVHGVTDANSFRQSRHQIVQEITRSMAIARRR